MFHRLASLCGNFNFCFSSSLCNGFRLWSDYYSQHEFFFSFFDFKYSNISVLKILIALIWKFIFCIFLDLIKDHLQFLNQLLPSFDFFETNLDLIGFGWVTCLGTKSENSPSEIAFDSHLRSLIMFAAHIYIESGRVRN